MINATLNKVERALIGYPASTVIACLDSVEAVLSSAGLFSDCSCRTQVPVQAPEVHCSCCSQQGQS